MTHSLDESSTRIIRAVKAELARRDKTGADLVDVLGLNRNAVYTRLGYGKAFDTMELAKIADFLGITITELLASADLDRIDASDMAVAS